MQVLLESETVPNQKALSPFVFKEITGLGIEVVDTLKVYGRLAGEKSPCWSQLYTLSKAQAPSDTKKTQDITTNVQFQEQTSSLKKLAASSNLDTIATHLNQVIADEKVTVKLIPEDKLLKVIVETNQFLDGQLFAERIYKELKNFDLSDFQTVGIYKQKLKSGQGFEIKAFSLADLEQSASEPQPKAQITYTQLGSTTRQITQVKPQQKKATKPKIRFGRIIAFVGILVVTAFVLFIVLRRIFILVFLSPVLGSFSVIFSLFILWRNYSLLMFLFQNLLRLLAEE